MYSSLLLLRRRDEVMKLFRKARETLPETLPQNRIEELFVAGTDDLGARKSFYELLLASDVFVEGTASEKSRDAAGGFHVVGVDPGLTVESFGPPGQQFIVFYTSLSRMDGQLATLGRRRGQRYVRVNARTLFDGFPLADFVMEKLKPVLDAAEMSHSVLFGDWKSNKHMIPEGTEPFYIRQEP